MSHDDTETSSIEHWHKVWLQQCELTRKAQDRCSRLVAMSDELRAENKKLQGQIRFLNRVVNTCEREHEECQLPSVMATSKYPFPEEEDIERDIVDYLGPCSKPIESLIEDMENDWSEKEVRKIIKEMLDEKQLIIDCFGHVKRA